MSTVTIVMSTYNGEKYVGEQIDSILASTFQDFELYITDDGSKDSTVAILRTYESQNPSKIHVVENETNLGVTANFLQAMKRTTSDYIMFCDQDDYWKSNKIAITLKRIRNMEAQTGKGTPMAVFTDAMVVDQELNVLRNSFFCSNHLNPKRTDLPHLLMENKLIGCTVMVNAALRRVLQSRQMPKQAKYHDWWVALIAASMGKISYVREATILYRQHGGNVVGGADFLSYIHDRLYSLHRQKEAILSLERQADEFLEIYGDILPEDKLEILRSFADLEQNNFIKKRLIILRNGYLKTGLIRNIGLLLII